MAQIIANIDIALSGTMPELLTDDTYCWVDNAITASLGVQVGDQIRITRTPTEYALYTIRNSHNDSGTNKIRLASGARSRLGTTGTFAATASNEIFHPSYTDAEAEANSEYVERFTDGGASGLAICAIHGGGIEPWTDDEAERISSLLSSSDHSTYTCKGWKQGGGPYTRWHITSTEVSPRSFSGIGTMQSRQFQYAVSLHGFSGSREVVIGGAAPLEIRQRISSSIAAALPSNYTVRIAVDGEPIDGNDPSNFVNYITKDMSGGIQLEQTLDARTTYWQQIAGAIASVFNSIFAYVDSVPIFRRDTYSVFRTIATKKNQINPSKTARRSLR